MMSAICIRYKADDLTKQQLSKLHFDVAAQIESEGQFWFATTEMKGKTWFRINPVNIRTTQQHMEQLYQVLKQKCKQAEVEIRREMITA
jgi:4-hydroxy-3-methylbut-2-en-1-yl diphosphate synthase IspG/GcpE